MTSTNNPASPDEQTAPTGDQHTYENHAPNQGAQGTFYGDVRTVATQGGDYAEGNIDKRQGTFIEHQHLAPTDPLLPIDPAEARARFAALPIDRVPEVATLPPGSRMPLNSNTFFTGRDGALRDLATTLKTGRTSVVTAGIDGVGKTSVAVETFEYIGQVAVQYQMAGAFKLSQYSSDRYKLPYVVGRFR